MKLRIHEMQLNGQPYLCPECDTTRFALETQSPPFGGMPARGYCANSCSWEDVIVTNEVVHQIQAARTGRAKTADEDTFTVTVGPSLLTGTLAPEFTLQDAKTVGSLYWKRLVKPQLRRGRRRVVKAGRQAVGAATGGVKAAVLRADWQAQFGGWDDSDHEAAPVLKCTACKGKGKFSLDTHVHSKTGRASVPCTICAGTGEA